MDKKYIYKITHCYGGDDYSIFVKSQKEVKELIEILACIDFKFEELVDETSIISEKAVGLILEKYYGVEIISGDLKAYLKTGTKMDYSNVRDFPTVKVFDVDGYQYPVIQIDRFWGRESCCGPNYDNLMKKHIPTSNEFNEMLRLSEIG